MRHAAIIALLATSLCVPTVALRGSVSPVAKVIQMLSDMEAKGKAEKTQEEDTYRKFALYSKDEQKSLAAKVVKGRRTEESLVAFITKAQADREILVRKIAETDKESDALEKEQKDAEWLRKTQHDEFLAAKKNNEESIGALDGAIDLMEKQPTSVAQAAAMLQEHVDAVPGLARVVAELQMMSGSSNPDEGVTEAEGAMVAEMKKKQKLEQVMNNAGAVAGYEGQTGKLEDTFESLELKFKDDEAENENAEMRRKNAHSVAMLSLGNTIKSLQSKRQNLEQQKAQVETESASAEAQLGETRSEISSDQKLLAQMKTEYEQKTSIVEENQQVRADELEAIGKAIEIMNSPDVAKYGQNTGKTFAQTGASFMQLTRHAESEQSMQRQRVIEFLGQRALAIKSNALAGYAAKLAANPFEKIITMIEDQLAKMKKEAAEEADHKAFCDEELKKNKIKRNKHNSAVTQLTADIEKKESDIEVMASKIETLAKEQAELRETMSKASAEREEEKEENLVAIKDAKAGQVAVKQALAVLKEFYSSTASLVQIKQAPGADELQSYGGMGRSNGGVVGMMEVILSDFHRVEVDTTAAEDEGAASFKAFMEQADADLGTKHKAEFDTSNAKDQAEFDKSELEKDLGNQQEQLDDAEGYFDQLKPQCMEVKVSYEERKRMREQEIAALKEAYAALDAKS